MKAVRISALTIMLSLTCLITASSVFAQSEKVDLKLTLTAPDRKWKLNEEPKLKFTLTNQGRDGWVLRRTLESFEIEVDDVHYRYGANSTARESELKGGESVTLTLGLTATWMTGKPGVNNRQSLKLTPGKHKIRVLHYAGLAYVKSPVVEIEVTKQKIFNDIEEKLNIYPNGGRIIDAKTAQPVNYFTIQSRFPPMKNDPPDLIRWQGGSITLSARRRHNQFTIRSREGFGSHIFEGFLEFRVIAEGYAPKHVEIPIEDCVNDTNNTLYVLLDRGKCLRGQVIDHADKPVTNAKVFVVGKGLQDGFASDHNPNGKMIVIDSFDVVRVRTDHEGRFELHGINKATTHVAVRPDDGAIWVTPIPEDLTKPHVLKKPAPAQVIARLDPKEFKVPVQVYLRRIKHADPGWQPLDGQIHGLERTATTDADGKVVFKDVAPGTYQLEPRKSAGFYIYLTQSHAVLKSGQTHDINFSHPDGHVIRGKLAGLPEGKWSHAVLYVKSPGINEKKPDVGYDRKSKTFDALTFKPGEGFQTRRLPPGKYELVVQVFKPLKNAPNRSVVFRRPDLASKVMVTITKDGAPELVTIQLPNQD